MVPHRPWWYRFVGLYMALHTLTGLAVLIAIAAIVIRFLPMIQRISQIVMTN